MKRWKNVVALCAAVLAGASFAGNGCPTNMSDTTPAGSANPNTANAQTQGPQGPPGPPGSDATVTAGAGIDVAAGVVSLDTAFTNDRYWKQGGNANANPATRFLGTTDAQPMELRANNKRAFRLAAAERFEPGAPSQTFRAPNVVGGYEGNSVDPGVVGATVFGGWEFEPMGGAITMQANQVQADLGTVSGGKANTVSGPGGAIVGGDSNTVTGANGFVGAGNSNTAGDANSVVVGGLDNQANGLTSFVGGGQLNVANGGQGAIAGGFGNEAFALAFVGGGQNNQATALYATVPGGFENQATGPNSFAAGSKARAVNPGSFVWCDPGMTNGASSFSNNQFLACTTGGIVLQRTDPLNGSNATASNAAVMIEKLNDTGEALWIWQRKEQPANIPVVKMHRNSNATNDNNYVEGWDWSGPGLSPTLVRKFHINKNGTFVAGGDFAEALPAHGDRATYEPGDVLILSSQWAGKVEKCRAAYDTKVAGVYSTRPGLLGADKSGETRVDAVDVPVAITGIVPTKASCENGPIRPGDLLTTSKTPGHAMRATPVKIGGVAVYPTGTILGKAVEGLARGAGKIRVLVTLR